MGVNAEQLKRERVGIIFGLDKHTFITFKGAAMYSAPGTDGFVPLTSDRFAKIMYKQFGLGISKSQIADAQHAIETAAPDWSEFSHLIGFADGRVWNTRTLDWDPDADKYVYQTTEYTPQPHGSAGYKAAKEFLLQLARGDADLAFDYQQSFAPLFMAERPSGIIWFVGNGANGKSALLSALYLPFGRFFASLDTKQLEDGKALPSLAGKMGNLVQEGSEARVEDAGNYKLLGTRQDLTVRKMYTQEMVTVGGDFHTIFNANNIPVFGDKTDGVRRRTLVVPFLAHFADDPTFEARTFTREFIGGLLTLGLEAAVAIRDNANKYKWSDTTLLVKQEYDSQVNTAEAFCSYLQEKKILGVYNWSWLYRDYQDWCAREGHVALGLTALRRTVREKIGMNPRSVRVGERVLSRFFFDQSIDGDDKLVWDEGTGYGVATPKEAAKQWTLNEQEELNSGW